MTNLPFLATDRRQRLLRAIPLFLQAANDASDCDLDPWQLAVPLRELVEAGVLGVDIRWLIAKGMVKHAAEVDGQKVGRRLYVPIANLSISESSCFLITEVGQDWMTQISTSSTPVAANVSCTYEKSSTAKPFWDARRRELKWRDQLVKSFRVPAPSQEVILSAFSEEGWPTMVDDPLPRSPEMHPEQRLQAAVRGLNRHHAIRAIRFFRNGTGEAICWESLDHNGLPVQLSDAVIDACSTDY